MPPADKPAVVIRFVDSTMGLGVFAARPISRGEFIFHERPVITGLFNEQDSDNANDMKTQEEAVQASLTTSTRLAVGLAFPRQAAEVGLSVFSQSVPDPLPFGEIGTKLVHGILDPDMGGDDLEGYLKYVRSVSPSETPTKSQRRKACRDFFKEYAFQVRPPNSATRAPSQEPSKACIYLLGSLINHCCAGSPGPNCEFQIGPSGLSKFVEEKAIVVRARRDIPAGQQLSINYGKLRKGFDCHCETCDRKLPRAREACIMM